MAVAFLVLSLDASSAQAWPGELSQRIAKDALRLLPLSLAELFRAHEKEIFSEARVAASPALSLVYRDIPKGQLGVPARAALAQEVAARVKALHGDDFRGAVIALGALYRIAVDLPDPAINAALGTDSKTRAIRREFYLFVEASRDKIPVVLVQPDALRLKLEAAPDYLAGVLSGTQAQATVLREEAQEGGRVLPYTEIDYRSPVFAVASTAYSRSVSAVAALWIAVWRSAGGDMQRQKPPRLIDPSPHDLN